MPINNCRGNKIKQKLVDDYDIVPLSFLKLLPNQERPRVWGLTHQLVSASESVPVSFLNSNQENLGRIRYN